MCSFVIFCSVLHAMLHQPQKKKLKQKSNVVVFVFVYATFRNSPYLPLIMYTHKLWLFYFLDHSIFNNNRNKRWTRSEERCEQVNNIISFLSPTRNTQEGGGELGGMTVHMNFKMNHLTTKELLTYKSDNWGNAWTKRKKERESVCVNELMKIQSKEQINT